MAAATKCLRLRVRTAQQNTTSLRNNTSYQERTRVYHEYTKGAKDHSGAAELSASHR